MSEAFKHLDKTEKIIKAYYRVYNILGYGFLEKVYENSLCLELISMGFHVEKQRNITVFYKGNKVGDYFADLIVDDCVIIELKAAESLCAKHEFQLTNYLRATNIEVGLLFNFGKEPEMRRKVFSNNRKHCLQDKNII